MVVIGSYDMKNKLVAFSGVVGDARLVYCGWGSVVVITAEGKALLLEEKDLPAKLAMLYRKNLFPVAVNLTQSEEGDDVAATAEVLHRHEDLTRFDTILCRILGEWHVV